LWAGAGRSSAYHKLSPLDWLLSWKIGGLWCSKTEPAELTLRPGRPGAAVPTRALPRTEDSEEFSFRLSKSLFSFD